MNPGKLNLVCPQGATFVKDLTFKIDGVAVNISSYTARMQARKTHASSEKAIELTTENNRIALGANGSIALRISATDTALINPGKYVYDLEIQSNDGTVYRLVEGSFLVTPEVTR